MTRKKREYSPAFTAFWDAWSGRNAGADKTRSADIWDAAAFTDQTVDRILDAAGSVPADAVPMAWLRDVANETARPDGNNYDIQISENKTAGGTVAVQPAPEKEREDESATDKPQSEIIDIQISENITTDDASPKEERAAWKAAEIAGTNKPDESRTPQTAETANAIPQANQTETTPAPPVKGRRGRPKKDVPTIAVMLHIRPETRAWLKREAFETERTMSEIVDALVADATAQT